MAHSSPGDRRQQGHLRRFGARMLLDPQQGSLNRGKESLDECQVALRRRERPSPGVKVALAWLAVALNLTKDLSPALEDILVRANGSSELTKTSSESNKVAATAIESAWARGEELSGRSEEGFTERKERLGPRKVSTDGGKAALPERASSWRSARSSVAVSTRVGAVFLAEAARERRAGDRWVRRERFESEPPDRVLSVARRSSY